MSDDRYKDLDGVYYDSKKGREFTSLDDLVEEAKKQGFKDGVRKATIACDSTFGSMLKELKKEHKAQIEEARKEKEEEFKLRFNPDYLDFKKGVKQERDRLQWKFEEYIRVWFGKKYLDPEDKDMNKEWKSLQMEG